MLYFPVHLNIETSDLCNRSCSYCPVQRDRDQSPARLLDVDLYRRLLLELADAPPPIKRSTLKISLQWIDEPLANPSFLEYARLGRKLCPDAMWLLQTNGDFMTQEIASELESLFDAVVVNFYAASAKTSFEARGIDVERAGRPDLIQHPGRLRRRRTADGIQRRAVFHTNEKFHDDDWVQTYDEVACSPDTPCHRPWVQAAVGYDGQVYVCCRDNLKSHPVGHLGSMSLFEAYNSPAAMVIRRRMEAGRRDRIAMCHTCPGEYLSPVRALSSVDVEEVATHARGAGPRAPLEALRLRPVVDEDRPFEQLGPPRASLAVVENPAPPSPVAADLDRSQMPWGLYDYWTARTLARELGHVVLPGFQPRRYEVVVGLTPSSARAVVDEVRAALGPALAGLWVCGSRVMTRRRLREVDPTPFLPDHGLRVGAKGRLRELGDDVRLSSDLDFKILAYDDAIDEEQGERLGRSLGERLEMLVPHTPVSGHLRPRVRIWRVPRRCRDARSAFAYYNDHRLEWIGKVGLSLEYTNLLFDPATGDDVLALDASAPVRARLGGEVGVELPIGLVELLGLPDDEGERLRATWDGLTGHQLTIALADFPELHPRGVVVEDFVVVRGALAVWAAERAGRVSFFARVAEEG